MEKYSHLINMIASEWLTAMPWKKSAHLPIEPQFSISNELRNLQQPPEY